MADHWFRVHQADFRQVFAMAMNAVEMRSTIPILAHVLFQVVDGVLKVRASDLGLQVDAECDALDVTENAAFCLPADRLKDLMANLPDKGELSFGPGRLSGQISIASGKTRLSIPFLPADDFPSIDPGDRPDWFGVDGDEMSKAVGRSLFAVNRKDDRTYLQGLCFHASTDRDEPVMVVAATDGISLARIYCEGAADPRFPDRPYSYEHVIVPSRTAEALRRLFDGAQLGCEIATTDSLIMARRDRVRITSKLIDGTYPDYVRVIPPSRENWLEVETSAFVSSVKRVCVVIDDQKHDAIRMVVTAAGITLDLVGETGGIAQDEITCTVSAPIGFEMGLNGAQLLKLLANVSTERLRIYLTDALTPVAIIPVGAEHQVYVLMPMRFRIAPGRTAP